MKERFKALWSDERPFKRRLLLALLAAFSVAFTFLFVGPLDLYMNNIGMFPFTIGTLIGPVILLAVGVTVVLAAVVCVLRGRIFDLALSLLGGFLLSGYLQGNFLNVNLGELTGDRIDWSLYTTHGYINTVVWTLLFIAPMVIYLLLPKAWKKLVVILPAMVVGMQLVGLTSTALQTDFSAILDSAKTSNKYLSDNGIFELSSRKNVLVFILDRLDGKYIDQVKAKDPDFFDDLEGFTYYNNYMSLYCRTYPSVTNMLTGEVSYYDKPASDYFTEAYQRGTFLPDLKKNDFTTKLYVSSYYAYTDVDQLDGLADNIVNEPRKIEVKERVMMRRMLRFTAFRYAPHVAKQYFWLSPEDFLETVNEQNEIPPFSTEQYRFGEQLKEKSMTLQQEKNNFMYLHLKGSHADYDIDENGNYVGAGKSDLIPQTKGYFNLIKQYLREMKEIGVYDDATIIITGDHGKSEDYYDLDTYKTTGLFVKRAGDKNTPLRVSDKPVSQDNFQATVLQGAGLSTEGYGKSVWEVPDDDRAPRRFLYKVNDGRLQEFSVVGDANDFDNWTHVKDHPVKYNY